MRKRVFGRKFKRTTNQRKGLFKSLALGLVTHGRITTTEAKAKAVRGEVEKLITIAKKHPEGAMQFLQKHVSEKTAEGVIRIAPVFKDRPGGYTRIVKLGTRKKDNAAMVILEFVERVPEETKKTEAPKVASSTPKEEKKTNREPAKRTRTPKK